MTQTHQAGGEQTQKNSGVGQLFGKVRAQVTKPEFYVTAAAMVLIGAMEMGIAMTSKPGCIPPQFGNPDLTYAARCVAPTGPK